MMKTRSCLLVQRRRHKTAAVKLMRRLLKNLGFTPSMPVTDRLRSYGAAKTEMGSSARTWREATAA
jgi:transposase-like protein